MQRHRDVQTIIIMPILKIEVKRFSGGRSFRVCIGHGKVFGFYFKCDEKPLEGICERRDIM